MFLDIIVVADYRAGTPKAIETGMATTKW